MRRLEKRETLKVQDESTVKLESTEPKPIEEEETQPLNPTKPFKPLEDRKLEHIKPTNGVGGVQTPTSVSS